jgi:hypothetical protein
MLLLALGWNEILTGKHPTFGTSVQLSIVTNRLLSSSKPSPNPAPAPHCRWHICGLHPQSHWSYDAHGQCRHHPGP